MNLPTTIHPKHTATRTAREHARISQAFMGSACELFGPLRDRLLASHPIIGDMKPIPGADGIKTPLRPIYGQPTFWNKVVDGVHL